MITKTATRAISQCSLYFLLKMRTLIAKINELRIKTDKEKIMYSIIEVQCKFI